MKRLFSAILVVCLLVSCISIGVYAAGDSAGNNSRYTGLVGMTVSLSVSDLGRAVVSVSMNLRDGYKGQMHVDLYQMSSTVTTIPKAWNISMASGGDAWAGVWYVAKGNLFFARVTLDVYTTSGTYVETVTLDSNTVYY